MATAAMNLPPEVLARLWRAFTGVDDDVGNYLTEADNDPELNLLSGIVQALKRLGEPQRQCAGRMAGQGSRDA